MAIQRVPSSPTNIPHLKPFVKPVVRWKINELIDYLEEREQQSIPTETNEVGVIIPKPEWWVPGWWVHKQEPNEELQMHKDTYLEALSDASKASGITFKIEE